jgi:hypothetical protein
VTRASGLVKRTDSTVGGETTVVLEYMGEPATASVMTNPRVLIGMGLTITARKRLVVRLVKTTDANRPVHLSVTARGQAVRGRKEEVLLRAPQLQLGGQITRTAAGWTWTPFG